MEAEENVAEEAGPFDLLLCAAWVQQRSQEQIVMIALGWILNIKGINRAGE